MSMDLIQLTLQQYLILSALFLVATIRFLIKILPVDQCRRKGSVTSRRSTVGQMRCSMYRGKRIDKHTNSFRNEGNRFSKTVHREKRVQRQSRHIIFQRVRQQRVWRKQSRKEEQRLAEEMRQIRKALVRFIRKSTNES